MRCALVFLLVLLVLASPVSAGVLLGNESHSFLTQYTPGSVLNGWVNVSLVQVPKYAQVSALNKNVSVFDFFAKNNINCGSSASCSCLPLDCSAPYAPMGSAVSSLPYSAGLLSLKLFGTTISGNISQINSFEFLITSDAPESCFPPLKVDLLNDGTVDWVFDEVSSTTCFSESPYGCFTSLDSSDQTTITADPFCGKIMLSPMRGYSVGARVTGSGGGRFHMTLDASSGGTCYFDASGAGEYSCMITLDSALIQPTEAEVCIFADELNTNVYTIRYEDVAACGFSEDGSAHDFEIFALPLKYKEFASVTFSDGLFSEPTLADAIKEYVASKFSSACNPSCVIPFSIFSGVKQNITLSNLQLKYKANGLDKTPVTTFYPANESQVLLFSPFVKLDVSKGEFSVPDVRGNYSLVFVIDNASITKTLSVKNAPTIQAVFPKNPPLLVATSFFVVVEGIVSNTSYAYQWNFGDGSPVAVSSSNSITHIYKEMKPYTILVTISGDFGNVTGSFPITVSAPYEAINETLVRYNTGLTKVDRALASLPVWVSDSVKKSKDFDGLKASVARIDTKYKETLQSEHEVLVGLMNELVALHVPIDFGVGQSIASSKFTQNQEQLDVSILEELGAGTASEDASAYYDAINRWVEESIDITVKSDSYLVYYDEGSEPVATYLTFTLSPKSDIDEFFFVVAGEPSTIKFKEDYTERDIGSGYGLRLSELTSPRTIEFILAGIVQANNLPVYVAPEFRNLEFSFEAGVCNNNDMCEASLGENYNNCRADCKPWSLTLIFLFVLIVITLIIYIALQEWYKHRYASYLFKDKNQLFNLMAFMSNAQNSGMKKQDILDKLKPYKWNSEQLNYAWNKLHGKRTGMWEIPLFKVFENREVKKEMEKRGASPVGLARPLEKPRGFFGGIFGKREKK